VNENQRSSQSISKMDWLFFCQLFGISAELILERLHAYEKVISIIE